MNINWRNHGVGTRFVGAELSHVDPTYFQEIHEYSEQYPAYLVAGKGLLLSGSVGCGKSYATVALMKCLRENMDSRFDFYFITAPDLFELLDDKKAMDTYRLKKWVDVFSTIPALVINDLGKEDRSKGLGESVTIKLGRLLRKRHEAMLPIFVTTNLPLVPPKGKTHVKAQTVQSVYGTSIWSMLYEMTEYRAQVNAPDRRIPTKEEMKGVSHEG